MTSVTFNRTWWSFFFTCFLVNYVFIFQNIFHCCSKKMILSCHWSSVYRNSLYCFLFLICKYFCLVSFQSELVTFCTQGGTKGNTSNLIQQTLVRFYFSKDTLYYTGLAVVLHRPSASPLKDTTAQLIRGRPAGLCSPDPRLFCLVMPKSSHVQSRQ